MLGDFLNVPTIALIKLNCPIAPFGSFAKQQSDSTTNHNIVLKIYLYL
jgi:hypothetical protein